MLIPTDDDNILCFKGDRTLIARVLTSISYGDLAIHPLVVDMGPMLSNPVVRFRQRNVAKIDVLTRSADNLALSAKITFYGDNLSVSLYQMYCSGILSSFVIDLDIRSSRSIGNDDRFPIACKTFVEAATLRAIDVDPYAPV